MEFQVVWTEPAIADLEAISAYIERQSRSAAEKVTTAILA